MEWLDAQKYCEDNGGFLAESTDAFLQETLTAFAKNIYGGIPYAWLGGNDIGTETEWKWIHSDTNITENETFWCSGCPRDRNDFNCL